MRDTDELLKSTVSSIANIRFNENDPAWTQATLPVRCGGLGIRSAVQLAERLLENASDERDQACLRVAFSKEVLGYRHSQSHRWA